MNSKTMIKLALSGALVAIPVTGITAISYANAKGDAAVSKEVKKAMKAAKKAEKLFAEGKKDDAAKFAEQAVAGDMTNSAHRALLARIYLSQGKFVSAERTLMDVMELGISDPRTVISLSLTRIAQGKTDSAIAVLDANRSLVTDGDYGLALALVGRAREASDLLTSSIREKGGNARVRQNLALALALDGRWREARLMASQDLDQSAVNRHIADWAQYARPNAYERRVAGLLGVTPQRDAGQPVRLALANTNKGLAAVSSDVAPATEIPVETAATPASMYGELAAVGPAPVATSAGFAASEGEVATAAIEPIFAPIPAMEAPLIEADTGPVKAASIIPAPVAKPQAAKPPVKLALADTAPRASVGGKYLVQLGAYSSTDGAQKAWGQLRSRHSVLSGFTSASSSVTVNGKRLVRLAASGFGNKASADQVCNQIKSRGGTCIVRNINGAAPARMASASPRRAAGRRIASR